MRRAKKSALSNTRIRSSSKKELQITTFDRVEEVEAVCWRGKKKMALAIVGLSLWTGDDDDETTKLWR